MEALKKVPQGSWREFAAFAGEPLDDLTNWGDKVVLVGESSHALAGAFGSGAAFAMEDAWTLARALEFTRNDKKHAARIYNDVRMPFYTQIHDYLEDIARKRAMKLQQVEKPTVDDKIRIKVVRSPGQDLRWIYDHDIAKVWEAAVPIPGRCRKSMMPTPMITIDAYNSV
jgi:salicylate hydroxylase